MTDRFDLIVVGGGSGGCGAALAAARAGLRVLVVEREPRLGGTATQAWVSCWEMGCGGTGLPFDLYRRLRRQPQAIGIYRYGRHICWPEDGRFPGGEQLLDPTLHYTDTLCRSALGPVDLARQKAIVRQRFHGVPFEPDAMAQGLAEALAETGRATVLTNRTFVYVHTRDGHLDALTLDGGEEVRAAAFVDGTGDGALCAACGCERLLGQDPRSRFGEPGAPETAADRVNGASLLFRIGPKPERGVDPLPADIPATCWWAKGFPVAAVNELPAGGFSVNLLPTLDGQEYLRLGPAAAYAECRRRVLATWHHHQTNFAEWQGCRIVGIAPTLGVRESHRVLCEYMLTQHDLEAGLAGQAHPDIVAIADHTMDTHGAKAAGGTVKGVRAAYGIPYRCLVPKGFGNLLVACRGAGFSAIAASSCRLQRTLITLGQAAGTAAALACERRLELPAVPPAELRERLRTQHVQLEWPPPDNLAAHLSAEDAR